METMLFFISSTRHTCGNRLEGIHRYARGRDWHVQVVERAFHKVNVKRQLDFWQPVGVIAECGSGASELNAEAFGAVPAVYFDADRAVHGPGCYVALDSAKVGALAAEHLLSLDLPHYAFAAFRLYRVDAEHAKLSDCGEWRGGALGIPADGFVLALSGFSLGDAPAADRAPSSSDNGL